MIKRDDIIAALKEIMDPELNISLWDLGLIYDIIIKDGDVEIVMTLTSVGCPLFGTIQGDIEEKIKKIKGVKKVTVDLTFEPPWSMDKMSEEAHALLGL